MTTDMNLTAARDLRLAGRTAIVTGSTSGIGAAIASTLAREGAHVIASGRDGNRGQAIIDRIRDAGGRADFLEVDLGGSCAALRALAADAAAALGGRVDVLVNNAGIYPVTGTDQLPDADLDAMLATNIRAPHVLVGEIAPGMAARGYGAIVNVGSWMAQVGSPYGAMYTATKAADEQLTRSWAAEYGPRGVRVNAIAPGVTLTPGNEAHLAVLDAMTATTPAGKPVQPQDVANGVLYLASDENPRWSMESRCTWTVGSLGRASADPAASRQLPAENSRTAIRPPSSVVTGSRRTGSRRRGRRDDRIGVQLRRPADGRLGGIAVARADRAGCSPAVRSYRVHAHAFRRSCTPPRPPWYRRRWRLAAHVLVARCRPPARMAERPG